VNPRFLSVVGEHFTSPTPASAVPAVTHAAGRERTSQLLPGTVELHVSTQSGSGTRAYDGECLTIASG